MSTLFARSLFAQTGTAGLFDLESGDFGAAFVPFSLLSAAISPPFAPDFLPPPVAQTTGYTVPPSAGSGADQAMLGDLARAQYGQTGAGVVIGVLSDSFDTRGGYAADVSHGLLNAGITVLKEGAAGSSDEGRAMAQLIHQVAPDAQIMFYSAFGGAADFANGIRALASAGASIIVDDVTYLNEPMYQDGASIQAAVEQVVASGVSYFTSASNQGSNFFESAFTPLSTPLPGLSGGFVTANFGTAAGPNPYVNLTIATGATATIDLQWDEPFASIAGGGAATSLGMVLYDASGRIVAYALRSQIGGDPVELMQFKNTTASTSFRMAVITDGGRGVPGQFKFIAYGQGTTIADPRAGIGSGSTIGHEMVPEANTVGAIAYTQTARYDGSTRIESFSSTGPGTFLFDAQGNRLAAPLSSTGVDFVAPDGSATSVFNPFFGTSAAAPNAAAVAALMLQQNPNLSPAQVAAILAGSTTSVTGPGGAVGSGLIQANAALKAAVAAAGPAGRANPLPLLATQPGPGGVVQTSAAIGSAASGAGSPIASILDGLALPAGDFVALPDLGSGLVLGNANSLDGVAMGNVALMNSFAGWDGTGLFDPIHVIG